MSLSTQAAAYQTKHQEYYDPANAAIEQANKSIKPIYQRNGLTAHPYKDLIPNYHPIPTVAPAPLTGYSYLPPPPREYTIPNWQLAQTNSATIPWITYQDAEGNRHLTHYPFAGLPPAMYPPQGSPFEAGSRPRPAGSLTSSTLSSNATIPAPPPYSEVSSSTTAEEISQTVTEISRTLDLNKAGIQEHQVHKLFKTIQNQTTTKDLIDRVWAAEKFIQTPTSIAIINRYKYLIHQYNITLTFNKPTGPNSQKAVGAYTANGQIYIDLAWVQEQGTTPQQQLSRFYAVIFHELSHLAQDKWLKATRDAEIIKYYTETRLPLPQGVTIDYTTGIVHTGKQGGLQTIRAKLYDAYLSMQNQHTHARNNLVLALNYIDYQTPHKQNKQPAREPNANAIPIALFTNQAEPALANLLNTMAVTQIPQHTNTHHLKTMNKKGAEFTQSIRATSLTTELHNLLINQITPMQHQFKKIIELKQYAQGLHELIGTWTNPLVDARHTVNIEPTKKDLETTVLEIERTNQQLHTQAEALALQLGLPPETQFQTLQNLVAQKEQYKKGSNERYNINRQIEPLQKQLAQGINQFIENLHQINIHYYGTSNEASNETIQLLTATALAPIAKLAGSQTPDALNGQDLSAFFNKWRETLNYDKTDEFKKAISALKEMGKTQGYLETKLTPARITKISAIATGAIIATPVAAVAGAIAGAAAGASLLTYKINKELTKKANSDNILLIGPAMFFGTIAGLTAGAIGGAVTGATAAVAATGKIANAATKYIPTFKSEIIPTDTTGQIHRYNDGSTTYYQNKALANHPQLKDIELGITANGQPIIKHNGISIEKAPTNQGNYYYYLPNTNYVFDFKPETKTWTSYYIFVNTLTQLRTWSQISQIKFGNYRQATASGTTKYIPTNTKQQTPVEKAVQQVTNNASVAINSATQFSLKDKPKQPIYTPQTTYTVLPITNQPHNTQWQYRHNHHTNQTSFYQNIDGVEVELFPAKLNGQLYQATQSYVPAGNWKIWFNQTYKRWEGWNNITRQLLTPIYFQPGPEPQGEYNPSHRSIQITTPAPTPATHSFTNPKEIQQTATTIQTALEKTLTQHNTQQTHQHLQNPESLTQILNEAPIQIPALTPLYQHLITQHKITLTTQKLDLTKIQDPELQRKWSEAAGAYSSTNQIYINMAWINEPKDETEKLARLYAILFHELTHLLQDKLIKPIRDEEIISYYKDKTPPTSININTETRIVKTGTKQNGQRIKTGLINLIKVFQDKQKQEGLTNEQALALTYMQYQLHTLTTQNDSARETNANHLAAALFTTSTDTVTHNLITALTPIAHQAQTNPTSLPKYPSHLKTMTKTQVAFTKSTKNKNITITNNTFTITAIGSNFPKTLTLSAPYPNHPNILKLKIDNKELDIAWANNQYYLLNNQSYTPITTPIPLTKEKSFWMPTEKTSLTINPQTRALQFNTTHYLDKTTKQIHIQYRDNSWIIEPQEQSDFIKSNPTFPNPQFRIYSSATGFQPLPNQHLYQPPSTGSSSLRPAAASAATRQDTPARQDPPAPILDISNYLEIDQFLTIDLNTSELIASPHRYNIRTIKPPAEEISQTVTEISRTLDLNKAGIQEHQS